MTKWYLCHQSGNWGTSDKEQTYLLNLHIVVHRWLSICLYSCREVQGKKEPCKQPHNADAEGGNGHLDGHPFCFKFVFVTFPKIQQNRMKFFSAAADLSVQKLI